MNSYSVRYADPTGQIQVRTMSGKDRHSLRRSLQEDGFFVFEVRWIPHWRLFSRSRIPLRSFLLFNREFRSMIRSGLPIVQGLDLLLLRMKPGPMKDLLSRVRSDLTRGEPLSKAWSHHRESIPGYYPALLLAGEQAGNLEEVLGRFLTQEDRLLRARKKFRNALTYPGFLLVVGMMALYVILGRAMPQFASLYEQSGQNMPALTRWVVAASRLLGEHTTAMIALLLAAPAVLLLVLRAERGRFFLQNLLLRLPLIGRLWRLQNQNIFARTLRLLLVGGTPLAEALAITADSLPSPILRRMLLEVRDSVLEGSSLDDALACVPLFDPQVRELVRVGETAGTLPDMLEHAAESGEEQSEDLLELISGVLAPLLLLGVGLVIAALVLAMYLPMFGVADLVTGS
jgi:type IV pilus assembly protein PilC